MDLGFDAEFREAVGAADTVDSERAVVVAGERPPGNEVHEESLHASGKVRQTHDPAAPARQLCRQGNDFPQGVDPRPAELVGLMAAFAAMQATQ